MPNGLADRDDSIWLADETGWVARFDLQDSLRQDVEQTMEGLRRDHLELSMLSGDSSEDG